MNKEVKGSELMRVRENAEVKLEDVLVIYAKGGIMHHLILADFEENLLGAAQDRHMVAYAEAIGITVLELERRAYNLDLPKLMQA